MGHGWTDARKARQAEAIKRWKPWSKSTGPVTDTGKATSSQNAHRVTIQKCLKVACYIEKQQSLYMAGKPHDPFEVMTARINYDLLLKGSDILECP